MTDLISRADAKQAIRDRFHDLATRVEINTVLNALPSADAVDCTDFVNWLTEAVMDEEDWEYNSVAYGEIICRKLEKLGVLEVTEEPSYYIRPSAEAEWIPCSDRLPNGDECGWYLVTVKGHELFVDVAPFNYELWEGLDSHQKVIAWQPLPKPYREDREVEE